MKLKIKINSLSLQFHKPARTSRDTLLRKPSYIVKITSPEVAHSAYGECSLIPGLSVDEDARLQKALREIADCTSVDALERVNLTGLPALQFALETALISLYAPHPFNFYDTPFSRGESGIAMNGLIWMDSHEGVLNQISDLSAEGFRILKMKVGAGSFEDELQLLKEIRKRFPASDFELRLDANGAFHAEHAMQKLESLAQFDIHSIEQPIRPGQHAAMRDICAQSPIPIALDEELIACTDPAKLLADIKPQYLILKPSLIGGLKAADGWIKLAKESGIQWWSTSALESNIGLNAIAQWCGQKSDLLPQGLGTGRLFTNNVPSPLEVREAGLWIGDRPWEISQLFRQ